LKAYIRIAGIPLPTFIDIEALICVILEDLVKKFRLKIEANDETKVVPLEGRSKIRVISLISNVPIAVQNLCTSGLLYIMKETKSVIILRTDWMNHYRVNIRRSNNIIKVQVNNEKARIELQYQHNYNCEYDYIGLCLLL